MRVLCLLLFGFIHVLTVASRYNVIYKKLWKNIVKVEDLKDCWLSYKV